MGWIILGVVVLLILVLIGMYNGLVRARQKVKNAWSQIDVQLQRRFDLIPNLVETVKGYMGHEKEVFTSIADSRAKLAGAKTINDKVEASNELEGALSRLLMITENYPALKADAQFQTLMDELAGTENRISVERNRYNESVKMFNSKIRKFPTSVVARLMGVEKRDYFEAQSGPEQAPNVEF